MQAFIEILILLGHLSMVQAHAPSTAEFQVVELLAGTARVSRLSRALGLPCAALDKAMCKENNRTATNCMDINTSAGFLLLASLYLQVGSVMCYDKLACMLISKVALRSARGDVDWRCRVSTWHLLQHPCSG